MHIKGTDIVVKEFGHYVQFTSRDADSLLNLQKSLLKDYTDQVKEVVYTPKEVLAKCMGKVDWDSFILTSKGAREEKKLYHLPIYFGGQQDWVSIIEQTGLAKSEYIEQLLSATFTLDLLGFVPGFLYFSGLPEALKCPRKDHPTSTIPPNCLAIGGEYLGFYALPTPSGWSILGQCPLVMTDFHRMPPVEVQVKDKVRLVSLSKVEYEALIQRKLSLTEYNEGL